MPSVHSGLRILLAASLVTLPLAGCGQVPTSFGQNSAENALSTSAAKAPEMARRFAQTLEGQGKVSVRGAVVTLETPEGGPVQYDFTKTPSTGKVTFRAGEYIAEVDYQDSQVQSWRLVWIAVRMIYGGTKAYFWYKANHTGSNFNREDLAKAIIYGMLEQGVAGLPVGFIWKKLFPIVWKWVLGEAPIKPNSLFQLWLEDKEAIMDILMEAQTLQR
ncbi:hypothetical protein D3C86_492100 [compost metagenome]